MIVKDYLEELKKWETEAATYEEWRKNFVNTSILPNDVAEWTDRENPLNIVGERIGHKRKCCLQVAIYNITAETDEEMHKEVLQILENLKDEYTQKKAEADASGTMYSVYMIEPGECLWGSSSNVYHNSNGCQRITDFKPNNIKSPALIHPAQPLFIPQPQPLEEQK